MQCSISDARWWMLNAMMAGAEALGLESEASNTYLDVCKNLYTITECLQLGLPRSVWKWYSTGVCWCRRERTWSGWHCFQIRVWWVCLVWPWKYPIRFPWNQLQYDLTLRNPLCAAPPPLPPPPSQTHTNTKTCSMGSFSGQLHQVILHTFWLEQIFIQALYLML